MSIFLLGVAVDNQKMIISVLCSVLFNLAALTALRETNTDLTEREAKQRALIARLEEDLNRASTWRRRQQHQAQEIADEEVHGGESGSPLTDLLSDNQDGRGSGPLKEEASILTIVQSQRDRLREQNRELEEVYTCLL